MGETPTVTAGTDTGGGSCCTDLDRIDSESLSSDVELLSAMGNDTRYELLRLIAGETDGVCVCDLEGAVGVSQSAVSQALSRLYAAGLVTRRKEGSWRYYEATDAAETLIDALDSLRGVDD